MSKVVCIADDSKGNPGYFPGWIKLYMKDGTEQIYDQRWEIGTPENPADMDAVMEKFHNNLGHFYSEKQMERLSDTIQDIDKLADIRELLDCLLVTKTPDRCRE